MPHSFSAIETCSVQAYENSFLTIFLYQEPLFARAGSQITINHSMMNELEI